MKIEEIKEILHLGEGSNIEFKSHCPDAGAIGPVVSGLLNSSDGGFIVCGVDGTGNIIGLDNADTLVKIFEQTLEKDLSPGTLVEIHVQNVQDKDLIILEVPPGRIHRTHFRISSICGQVRKPKRRTSKQFETLSSEDKWSLNAGNGDFL